VAAVFVMAMLSFGLGFYGVTVYVATLQRLHGLRPLHLIAGAQDGNPPVTGRFGPPIVSGFAGE